MKTTILFSFPVITLAIFFLYSMEYPSEHIDNKARVLAYSQTDTVEFDQEQALSKLRKQIEGKEEMPASEVFENIKVFKKMPAGRLLRVMEMGFTRSLGVDCTHCHNPDDWPGEEKPQKQIARDMMAMAGKINNELLSTIENLESEKPAVNCTTCHRGQVKPALNLDE